MSEVVNSLFGITPESLTAQRDQALQQEAMQYAKMDPFQRATAGIYSGANRLGGAIGGMLGAQDPEMQKAAALQNIMKQADTSTPEGLATLAKTLGSQGFGQQAMAVMDKYRQVQQDTATLGKTQAELEGITTKAARDKAFTEQMASLPEDATDEQRLRIAMSTGSQDTVMKVIEMSANKKAAQEQALALFKERQAAEDRRLRERGEQRLDEQQRLFQQQQFMAGLAASLKGPSAAVIKAQEKADKIAEGQAGLGDTVSVAKTLVNDIADMGGMTTTSKGSWANLMTSLGTGTVGQAGARLVGTATQAKRDELNSVRLQLFNAVKEATGMSSNQLNSNVELQTWLKSLGSDTMSKEANLAILNNIENRYLKKTAQKTTGTGTPENPIVLK